MSRIAAAFQKIRAEDRKALIPFIVCGDPNVQATVSLALTLFEAGADLLEIGVPFSDPSAEGPVIQRADARALAQDVRLDDVLAVVRAIRMKTDRPILLLSYYNVLYAAGLDQVFQTLQEAGVDGVIIPDLPVEERPEAAGPAKEAGIDLIPLVSPLSGSRIPLIVNQASGYVYAVSALGVTGERAELSSGLEDYAKTIRAVTDLPLAFGFGIHSPEQVRALRVFGDGLIVGSAIVRRIEEQAAAGASIEEICTVVYDYLHLLRTALDEGSEQT